MEWESFTVFSFSPIVRTPSWKTCQQQDHNCRAGRKKVARVSTGHFPKVLQGD
jgi:hypothetical protein